MCACVCACVCECVCVCACVCVCVNACVSVCVCVCVAGIVFKFDVCIIYYHRLSKDQLLIFWLKTSC